MKVSPRALSLLPSLVLILAIGGLAWATVAGTPPPPEEQPPASFDALRYDLPEESEGEALDGLAAVWRVLDRPLPAVEEAGPDPGPPPPPPPPATPDRTFELVLVLEDPHDQARSSGIVRRQGGGAQRSVGVGDRLDDGSLVTAIQVRLLGDERVAVMRVERGGEAYELELREPRG